MLRRLIRRQNGPRRHSQRIGDRELVTNGLQRSVFSDISHQAMTVSWPVFIAGSAIGFLLLNSVFAVLYLLGEHPIANAPEESFLSYLYFSIETLATVGFGDMHPQTHYAHLITSIEIFTGIFCIALMTGLIFSRFSRPQSRILFANVATIARHDGQIALMLRLANKRHNLISDARAKLWFVRRYTTREGRGFRGFIELPLLRSENPTFMLSWSIIHVIDGQSPMAGLTAEDLERIDAGFILSVTGLDENSAQSVHARGAYSYKDLRWNQHYVDILTPGEGSIHLDYQKFHEVESEPGRGEPADKADPPG